MKQQIKTINDLQFNVGDYLFCKCDDDSIERVKIVMVDKALDYACIMYDNCEVEDGPFNDLLSLVVGGQFNKILQNN